MFGFLKKLPGVKKFLGDSANVLGTNSMLFSPNGFIYDSESLIDKASLNKYNTSLLVFTCTDKIATSFASADFNLYKVLNTKGETEKLEVHPVLDLLYKPNDLQVKSEFMRIASINITLAGETFIKIIRDEKQQVIGFINIRPDIVDVVLKDGELKYIVNNGIGKHDEYDRTQIIHIKKPDPNNPLRGSGNLTPVINRVSAEQKAVLLLDTLFANQGRPDGILWVPGAKTKESIDQAKSMWRNSFSDKENDARVAVIGGTDTEFKYQQLTFTQKDMEMIEHLNHLRDDVAMAFGVPKALLTSDSVNYANAETAYKQFINFTIEPLLVLFEEVLNERFVDVQYDDALFLKHISLVTEDRKMVLDELDKGVDKWITVNEARQKMGYEPIGESGDKLFRTFGTQTIEQIVTPAPVANTVQNAFKGRPYLYKKIDLIEKTAKYTAILTRKKNLGGLDLFGNIHTKKAYVNLIHQSTDRNIKELADDSAVFLEKQGNRVIKNLKELPENETLTVDKIYDKRAEKAEVIKFVQNTYPKLALRAGNAGRVPVKSIYTDSQDFELDQALMNKINLRAVFLAETMGQTTYKAIGKLVAENLEQGLGRDVIARNIRSMFADMTTTRARTIAQTEGTVISNIGLKESFRQSPVVTGEKWLSAGDDKVRPEHVENDGQIIDKGGVFPSGEHYPGEDSINCRCVIAPVVE